MEKVISAHLTGNGGQSYHEMSAEDSGRLEEAIEKGSNSKVFKFIDRKSNNKVSVLLDKLFIIELSEKLEA